MNLGQNKKYWVQVVGHQICLLCSLCTKHIHQDLTEVNSLSLLNGPRKKLPCFTAKETKAQQVSITCPRSLHGMQDRLSWTLDPDSPEPGLCALLE